MVRNLIESDHRIESIFKCEVQLYVMDLMAQVINDQCSLHKLLILKLSTGFLNSFVSRAIKDQEL